MSGFIYRGQSTNTIISDSKLIVATFDSINEIVGHSRDNLLGGSTMTRPVANEYGTQYSNVSFEYALIKANLQPFSEEEQITVERWLSSPKFASDIQLFDCDNVVQNIYTGKFTHTEWVVTNGGYAGVVFTFECNSAYPHVRYEHNYTVSGTREVTFDCESDELEEYIYPVVTLYASNTANTVTIKNNTDNDNTMTIELPRRLKVVIDCDHCILTDGTTNGIVDFSDIGWSDVGNIYWLRLQAGSNTLTITGDVQVGMSYNAVSKKVGGWL